MIEVSKLCSKYKVRALNDSDADSILKLCLDNPQFYEYCETKTLNLISKDNQKNISLCFKFIVILLSVVANVYCDL